MARRSSAKVPLVSFLPYVAAVIRVNGYVGRSKAPAGVEATADSAWVGRVPPTDADKALAALVLPAVLADLSAKSTKAGMIRSSYDASLEDILSRGTVSFGTAGYVASIFPYYDRMNVRAAEAAVRAATPVSGGFLGAVKERMDVSVIVEGARVIPAWNLTAVDAVALSGEAVSFLSPEPPAKFPVGAGLVLRGTVKAHVADGYKRRNVTRMNRVVVS